MKKYFRYISILNILVFVFLNFTLLVKFAGADQPGICEIPEIFWRDPKTGGIFKDGDSTPNWFTKKSDPIQGIAKFDADCEGKIAWLIPHTPDVDGTAVNTGVIGKNLEEHRIQVSLLKTGQYWFTAQAREGSNVVIQRRSVVGEVKEGPDCSVTFDSFTVNPNPRVDGPDTTINLNTTIRIVAPDPDRNCGFFGNIGFYNGNKLVGSSKTISQLINRGSPQTFSHSQSTTARSLGINSPGNISFYVHVVRTINNQPVQTWDSNQVVVGYNQDSTGIKKYKCEIPAGQTQGTCKEDPTGQEIPTCPSSCGSGPPGGPGPDGSGDFKFKIENPIEADSITELVNGIAKAIFNIVLIVAPIIIIYAGVKFMTAKGEPTKVNEAKKALTYALIGLAVVFIGKGFIELIKSILNLGS